MFKKITDVLCAMIIVGAITVFATIKLYPEDWKTQAKRAIIYEKINYWREKVGVHKMEPDKSLEKLADYYSTICARNGRIQHDLMPYGERISFSGAHDIFLRYDELSENLAQCDNAGPGTPMKAWLLSEPHRKAMEDPEVDRMGLGWAVLDGIYFYTLYMGVENEIGD
jgi:uncharacterized protein YkwD